MTLGDKLLALRAQLITAEYFCDCFSPLQNLFYLEGLDFDPDAKVKVYFHLGEVNVHSFVWVFITPTGCLREDIFGQPLGKVSFALYFEVLTKDFLLEFGFLGSLE